MLGREFNCVRSWLSDSQAALALALTLLAVPRLSAAAAAPRLANQLEKYVADSGGLPTTSVVIAPHPTRQSVRIFVPVLPTTAVSMWWLVHAQVGKDLSLAHAMGVRDAKSPSALVHKLMHAGNDRVGVIGVAVPDVTTFEKLRPATLMGSAPSNGVIAAIHPRVEP